MMIDTTTRSCADTPASGSTPLTDGEVSAVSGGVYLPAAGLLLEGLLMGYLLLRIR